MYALKSFFSIRCKKKIKNKKKNVLFSLVLHMVGPSAQVLVSGVCFRLACGKHNEWKSEGLGTWCWNPSTGADLWFFRAKTPHWLEIADSTTNTLPQILTGLHPNPISADTTWGHTWAVWGWGGGSSRRMGLWWVAVATPHWLSGSSHSWTRESPQSGGLL